MNDLRQTIYDTLRQHKLTLSCCDDEPSSPYPLVDALSTQDPQSTIASGETEISHLTDELTYAIESRDHPRWTERLSDLDQRTETEQHCSALMLEIEKLGADPDLTSAVYHVQVAMQYLGRWHDSQPL